MTEHCGHQYHDWTCTREPGHTDENWGNNIHSDDVGNEWIGFRQRITEQDGFTITQVWVDETLDPEQECGATFYGEYTCAWPVGHIVEGVDYNTHRCEDGRMWIDREEMVGHDERGEEVWEQWSEQIPSR